MPNGMKYTRISTATTTVVKSGKGKLQSITLNKPVASSTITIYDNTAGSGTVIGLITNTTDVKPYDVTYNLNFQTGLTIVTSGADDLTVVAG